MFRAGDLIKMVYTYKVLKVWDESTYDLQLVVEEELQPYQTIFKQCKISVGSDVRLLKRGGINRNLPEWF